jgi:hypothetical protein
LLDAEKLADVETAFDPAAEDDVLLEAGAEDELTGGLSILAPQTPLFGEPATITFFI